MGVLSTHQDVEITVKLLLRKQGILLPQTRKNKQQKQLREHMPGLLQENMIETWDDSCGGNAHPSCTCGYADGAYTYCACGCGYVYNGDGGAEGWDDVDDENDDDDDHENSDEDDDENRDGADDDSEEAVEDGRSDWKRQRTDRNN